MKLFKKIKKHLKRTGGLALSTLLLAGSCAGSAFAAATDLEYLDDYDYVHDDRSTVIDDGPEGTFNNEGYTKDVLGYQIGNKEFYSVALTWGDMVFLYDQGTYNPDTGMLEKSVSDTDELLAHPSTEDKKVEKWYGFDGSNNKIHIENRGNKAIKASTVTSSSEYVTGVSLELLWRQKTNELTWTGGATAGYDEYTEGDAKTFLDRMNDVFKEDEYDEYGEYENQNYAKWERAGHDTTITTTLAAEEYDKDGTRTTDNEFVSGRVLFLDLYGEPNIDLPTDKEYAEHIGTVTLTFSKAEDVQS